jgi:hypothetical protein
MFQPHYEILSPSQNTLWPELGGVPRYFVLYGGTALALRLGHRPSLDFDFFCSEPISPSELLGELKCLKGGKVLQNVSQTLTVLVDRDGPVKLSFFANLTLGRVGVPDKSPDGILQVASLLDLAGTKAAVVTQRAESKDYRDILAILQSGITLVQAMAAAKAIYGEQYNPMITLKSLTYFGDGDLHKLSKEQQAQLVKAASVKPAGLPEISRVSEKLAA